MGFLSDLFGGGGKKSNPANAAMPYLNQIPGMLTNQFNQQKGYLDPFIQRGNSAYDTFNPIYTNMAKDPAAFLESLMQNYEPSRGFGLKKDAMLKAAGNTAAPGGMRGSLQDIDQEAKLTDSLLGDDMQQWLQNVLGIQGTGLSGESHLYDTGFDATRGLVDASRGLGDNLSNVLGTQAQLAFQGQREKNQRNSDTMSGIGKLAGGAIGAYFGGPWGAAAGANIGGSFF